MILKSTLNLSKRYLLDQACYQVFCSLNLVSTFNKKLHLRTYRWYLVGSMTQHPLMHQLENLFWVFIWMKPNSAPIGVLVDFEEKPRFIFFHVFFPPLCSSCSSSSLFFSFFPCNKFFEFLFFFYSFCDGAHWCVFGVKGCQGATITPFLPSSPLLHHHHPFSKLQQSFM